MRIKIVCILVCILLIATALPLYGKQLVTQEHVSDIKTINRKNISPTSLPDEWDWRDVDGKDWTSPVKDLLGNPFCMAFSFCSALEADIHINDGDPWGCDLSEAHIICLCGGPDSIINPEIFASKVRTIGVVDEECFPFTGGTINCDDICDNWEDHTTKILGLRKIGGSFSEETCYRIKKFLVKYGPLQATMYQYEDFQTYDGGIYKHQSGDLLTQYHGVAIVGYNDDPGYWICKDQKGTDWGEDGWFRIEYGECKIESYLLYYYQLRENPIPEKPSTPSGSSSGKVGDEYTYSTSSNDIEGDELYYKWDWGDGNYSDWLGPYASGETCEAPYTWALKGNYNITAKAKDDFYGESEWSDPLIVSMPKNKDADPIGGPWLIRGTFKYMDEDEDYIYVRALHATIWGIGVRYRLLLHQIKLSKPFYGFLYKGFLPLPSIGICREWDYVDT